MDYYSQIYSGSRQGDSVSLFSRACERRVAAGRAIRFEIPRRYLEVLTRTKLSEGKLYLMRGMIQSQPANGQAAWRFEIYRFMTPHLKLRIYLPKRYHGEVVPGATYKVLIGSISERKGPRSSAGIFSFVRHGGTWSRAFNEPSQPPETESRNVAVSVVRTFRSQDQSGQAKWIDWKIVAAWIDTEGYLYVKEGRHRKYALAIRQSEPEPLRRIQGFLKVRGITDSSVQWVTSSEYTAGGIYELKLWALRKLDLVVAKTRPFLMVPIRTNQYFRYRQRRKEAPNIVKFIESQLTTTQDPAKWMDWRVVAAWIDGEGNLTTRERGANNSHRDYCLDISQKERAPLESILSFLRSKGIKAKVVERRHDTNSLQVTSVSDIDRVVKETLPFMMTDNKRMQYEEYETRRIRAPKRGPRPKPPLF